MARANKTKVNLLVRSKWDGRMGTTTETIRAIEGRKGFRGYVGTHDTIRGYRSPKHRVIPASQEQLLLYKVVWHSLPAPLRSNFTTMRRSASGNNFMVHPSRYPSQFHFEHLRAATITEKMMAKDYYSKNDITILTKETQNGKS